MYRIYGTLTRNILSGTWILKLSRFVQYEKPVSYQYKYTENYADDVEIAIFALASMSNSPSVFAFQRQHLHE